jgi:hypothetical protein
MVEMAFVMPLLLLLFFGIIDLSYYIYGFATVYQAARNGAEAASALPPNTYWITPVPNSDDPCTNTILVAVQSGAVLFPDIAKDVTIDYPTQSRNLGEPIEVKVTYDIKPLTPLFQFIPFGNKGVMTVQATSRRTIESLGSSPNSPNGQACNPQP